MVTSKKIDDSDFEIQFYENLLQKKSDFVEALAALGDLYTKKGQYKKGLELDEQLARLKPEDPVVLYNLACSYSLLNNRVKAFLTTKVAITYGYHDFRFLEQDQDLTNLRNDSRFQKYFLRARKKILENKR